MDNQTDAPQRAFNLPIPRWEFIALCAALMALNSLAIDIMLPALQQIGASLGVENENAPESQRIDTAICTVRAAMPEPAKYQAARALMPFSFRKDCNSPAWNISRMMSQPPTNSPFT